MQLFVILLFLRFCEVLSNCPETTFLLEQLGITVTVPDSPAPSFQGTNELCVDGVYNIAVYECQSNSQWTTEPIILTSQCSITANVTFMETLKGVIVNGTADNTLQTLPFSKFVITDVTNIIDLLEEMVKQISNATGPYSIGVVKYIKPYIFQLYGQLMSETKFLLLRNSSLFAINKLLTSIEYAAKNIITTSSFKPEFYDTPCFSVSIFPIVSNWTISEQTIGISYLSSDVNITSCKANACSTFKTNETSLRISLNPIIVDVINKKSKAFNETPHINFITYKSNEYFQYNLNSSMSVFSTPTAVSISNYNELSSFVNKIDLIYVSMHDSNTSAVWKRPAKLAFLVMNKTGNIWATDGCRNLTYSLFACNHLTHFSVLMDVEQFYTKPASPTVNIEELVLTIISYIAICLSLIGLLITMLTFICFKKLRAHYSQKCIFNLALALFLMYLFFIINTAFVELGVITSSDAGCVIVGVLVHYFILASFAWMLIMAFIQYIMFIKVFPYYISNFALKAATICWGVPLIPIIIAISLNYAPSVVTQMPNQFVYGKIGSICWIQGLPFYLTVLLPVGLIVLLNTLIFIAVAFNLVWSAKTSNELYENQYEPQTKAAKPERPRSGRTTSAKATNNFDRKATCNRLITAIFSCFVILGLTWLFGFLAINQVRVAFSYLFCLFNASQGFMILIAYVLMSKPKREMWTNKLKAIKSSLHNITSNRTSSAEFDSSFNGSSDPQYARKRRPKHFQQPTRGVFCIDTGNSHDSNAKILSSLHKNSFTSTPKPDQRTAVNQVRGAVRHTSSSTSASSNEYSQNEMIKAHLDIKGFIDRRHNRNNEQKRFPFSLPFQKSEFVKPAEFMSKPESFLKSQKGVLASNKHLVASPMNTGTIVNTHTRPELLSSFTAENTTLRAALGFNSSIVPTPIMSAKSRKNIVAQSRRESTANDYDFTQGHRSRLSSQSLSNHDARTITPSGISVNGSETTIPGSVFYKN